MFQEAYQKAYEQIKPDEKSYERIQKAVADRRKEKRKVCRFRPAVSFACPKIARCCSALAELLAVLAALDSISFLAASLAFLSA